MIVINCLIAIMFYVYNVLFTSNISVHVQITMLVSSSLQTIRPHVQWHTETIRNAKHLRRRLERKWRKSKMDADHQVFRKHCGVVAKLLFDTKQEYYSEEIQACERNQRALFKSNKYTHGRTNCKKFPNY